MAEGTMRKKRGSFFILILFMLPAMVMTAGDGDTENISIDISGDNVQVTGMGGTSNVNVVSGCEDGSGISRSEKRSVPSFRSVSLDGAFDVKIELQKTRGVEVSGDDNIISHIVTEVKDGTLHVTTDKSICSKTGLRIHITNDDVGKITAEGSSDISVSDVKNGELAVSINGAGDFSASGTTGTLVAGISGSGSMNARKLHADEVRVSIQGAGDAVVYATKKLRASIEGAGDISYYGNPKEVEKNITGAGDIQKGD
jgi:hypothetical protein